MNEPDSKKVSDPVDWSRGTWEGSRREQMRRWAALTLGEAILALEEMEELAEDFKRRPTQTSVREPDPDSKGGAG